jgi:hypothetical protein
MKGLLAFFGSMTIDSSTRIEKANTQFDIVRMACRLFQSAYQQLLEVTVRRI